MIPTTLFFATPLPDWPRATAPLKLAFTPPQPGP
jgi:hypothetical protein